MQNVIIKLVLFVPEADTSATEFVHSGSNRKEMFEKLGCDIFVNVILQSELDRYPEHVQTKHPHPARAIALFQSGAVGKPIVSVEHANVVESEKTAFENVVALRILPVYPPDRKSTRLNSSHGYISYAVFCLKK